jgi:hypothetical protein
VRVIIDMEMIWFFLPMILFFGAVTSYEDWKHGKIRNKWVNISLVYSFVMLFAILAFLFVSGDTIKLSYISDYFINVAISFAFGFAIWKAGFWSAGDGKLFLAYSALVPLSIYSIGYVRLFPSFTIFINTLFPVFIFLVGSLLVGTGLRKKAEVLKKTANYSTILMAVLSLFGLSWLIRVLFYFSGIEFDMFSFIVFVPLIYVLISRIAKEKMKWIFVFLLFFRVVFDFEYLLSLDFVFRFTYIIIFYVFIKYFIFGLSYEFFSKAVKVEQLSEGMMLADMIYKKGGKYVVKPQALTDFLVKQDGEEKLIFGDRDLKKDDVEKIKRLHKNGKIGPNLKVQATMPFAIFMFIGALLTIAVGGNVIIVAKLFLGL